MPQNLGVSVSSDANLTLNTESKYIIYAQNTKYNTVKYTYNVTSLFNHLKKNTPGMYALPLISVK